MYCSSCGVAVAQGLSFCNYCGAKLNGVKGVSVVKSPEVKPELLVSAMVIVFVFGLVAITMLLGVMKSIDLNAGQILAFALLSFLIMLSIEGVIVRLLFRRGRAPEEGGDTVRLKGSPTNELAAAQARTLPEPVASVTEHTTRAFEPILSQRKAE